MSLRYTGGRTDLQQRVELFCHDILTLEVVRGNWGSQLLLADSCQWFLVLFQYLL